MTGACCEKCGQAAAWAAAWDDQSAQLDKMLAEFRAGKREWVFP